MFALALILLFATSAVAALGVILSTLIHAGQQAPALRAAALAAQPAQIYQVRVRPGRLAQRNPVAAGARIIPFPAPAVRQCALRAAA